MLLLSPQGVVHASFFTSCSFEKVFCKCSSSFLIAGLFENKEMVTFYNNLDVNADAEVTNHRASRKTPQKYVQRDSFDPDEAIESKSPDSNTHQISTELTSDHFVEFGHVTTISSGSVIWGLKHDDSQPYAFKLLSKSQLVESDRVRSIFNEAKILASVAGYPFITKLCGKFQTPDALGLVFTAAMGGDVWSLLHDKSSPGYAMVPRETRVDQELMSLPLVRHYLASAILALSHLHKHDIVFRNLKSENMLLDAQGNVHLTGFSLAKVLPYADEHGVLQNKTFTVCGTIEYMSPEMVLVHGQTTCVDSWTLGVLACELLTGTTPFAHAGECICWVQGKRRSVRSENWKGKVLHAIASTTTKGVILSDACEGELQVIPGAREMVLGDPLPPPFLPPHTLICASLFLPAVVVMLSYSFSSTFSVFRMFVVL